MGVGEIASSPTPLDMLLCQMGSGIERHWEKSQLESPAQCLPRRSKNITEERAARL